MARIACKVDSPLYTSVAMSLAPGTRLGPYAVVAKLGDGGMGEVYRGTDTRLGREVAMKVLAATTQSPDALAHAGRECGKRNAGRTYPQETRGAVSPLTIV